MVSATALQAGQQKKRVWPAISQKKACGFCAGNGSLQWKQLTLSVLATGLLSGVHPVLVRLVVLARYCPVFR